MAISYEERRKRIAFSRKYLKSVKKKEGILKCHYCIGRNLKIQYSNNLYIEPSKKATIDHVVPISKGGGIFDTTNLVVACERCNTRKSNMDYEEYLNKL
jgi:5-methylcytosine-specific restriction endonuclease McrA